MRGLLLVGKYVGIVVGTFVVLPLFAAAVMFGLTFVFNAVATVLQNIVNSV